MKLMFLVMLSIPLTTACSTSSPSSPTIKFEEKLEIVKEVQDDWDPLSLMSIKLITDWPKLFTLSDESQLFPAYARMTWHVRPADQERLKKDLANHLEFKQYHELYQQGVLPAQSYRVKNLSASWDEQKKEYKLDVVYEVILKSGNKKDIPVTLNVRNNQTEFINQKFNTAPSEEPAPAPKDKQEEFYQEFIFSSLSPNEIRKLTSEQAHKLLQK
jgi:hypothetical protein